MKLVSAISLPLIMIAIRTEIVTVQSATEAGYWEAMNRISNYYLVFFTTLLTLYILPKLSEINDPKAFRKEIFGFYKTILPLFAAGMLIIYVLKTYIIQIVLTDEFLPMSSLFFWQLSGDLVKIASIVIAYQFLAKNMFWHYIF
jgi:PST family polysaccharide transporter